MFILASSSPRRKQLLSLIVPSFKIIAPDVDEQSYHLSAKDLPGELSKIKAYAVSSLYPEDEILSCDTIVIANKQVLGKPKNAQNAIEMLSFLQGKRHLVLSGYTYIGKGKEITRSVSTYVIFNSLKKEQIEEYVNKYAPLDKAGAYGIQDDFPLVDHIEGSYYNVMGLPVEDIKAHIL